MKAFLEKVSKALDFRDLIFVAGLGLLFYGLWLFDPAFAYVGAGSVLLFMAMRR